MPGSLDTSSDAWKAGNISDGAGWRICSRSLVGDWDVAEARGTIVADIILAGSVVVVVGIFLIGNGFPLSESVTS